MEKYNSDISKLMLVIAEVFAKITACLIKFYTKIKYNKRCD